MTTLQKLSKIEELLDDVIEDIEHPEPMSPYEATALFFDYLEAFDADELEEALTKLAAEFKKYAGQLFEINSKSAIAMQRTATHLELATESWHNRPIKLI